MLQPSKALMRCQELMPHLKMEIRPIDPHTVSMKKVDMELWRTIYYRCMGIADALQLIVDEFPDTEPFLGLPELVEDLGALIQTLYIFYDCTMKELDEYT